MMPISSYIFVGFIAVMGCLLTIAGIAVLFHGELPGIFLLVGGLAISYAAGKQTAFEREHFES
jgi:hypothetical protein